jgi:hypothetical protein
MTRKLLVPALIAATLATTTGCYGEFAATRKIYGWNSHVSGNKIVNSAVMWGLIIIPVYELASLGDIIIFNPIEVVSGSNPLH